MHFSCFYLSAACFILEISLVHILSCSITKNRNVIKLILILFTEIPHSSFGMCQLHQYWSFEPQLLLLLMQRLQMPNYWQTRKRGKLNIYLLSCWKHRYFIWLISFIINYVKWSFYLIVGTEPTYYSSMI